MSWKPKGKDPRESLPGGGSGKENSAPRTLVGRALNRMSRYNEILKVLIRYGFTDLVRKVDIDVYRRLRGITRGNRESRRLRRKLSRAEGMRRAFEELGPAFVKIGQLLSHRPDLLPPAWIKEFEKLRSRVPPVNADEISRVVEIELGKAPEEIFAEFDPLPIASASIAQVHRAKLILPAGEHSSASRSSASGPDEESAGATTGEPIGEPAEKSSSGSAGKSTGESAEKSAKNSAKEPAATFVEIDVAVKIQRPGIRRTIETDLSILRDIVRIAEKRIPALAALHPLDAVRELERAMLSELDFRNEADNLDRFRENFSKDGTITAPEPFRHYSGTRVLTMSYMDGVHIGDTEALDGIPLDRRLLARRGAEAVLSQVFEHRFFHSDPHGGNILVLPDNTLAFLDFGQVGSILPSQRTFLADLLSALIRLDAVRAVRAIMNWSGYREPEITRRLTMDMEYIIEQYLSRPFGRLQIGEMVSAMVDLIHRYDIEIPSNFYLLSKALAAIEDIAASLDPDFDFIRAARPFARRMIRRELNPDRIADQIAGASGDALRFLRDFPGETRDLMNLIKSGKLKLEFELRDLGRIDSTLKKVVTRLSAAIMLAAMIMASSILVQSLIPPLVFGVPVIGILGFLFSGILGFVLLIDLWRHR